MSEVSSSANLPAENDNPKNETDILSVVEIDLLEKAQQIWEGRKTIIFISSIFFVFGLFHYTFAPEEYLSTATLIQEAESGGSIQGGGGFLQSLAGGLSIQNNANSLSAAARGRAPLPVSLYPIIVSSTDFQKDLIHRDVGFSDPDTTISLFEYYQDSYEEPFRTQVYSFVGDMTIFLPITLFDATRKSLRSIWSRIKNSDRNVSEAEDETDDHSMNDSLQSITESRIQVLSGPERGVIAKMNMNISLSADGGLTTINVTMPDGLAAANVNAVLVEKLQEYITEYRIEKARQNLEAIRQQEDEARLRYENAQMELANFEDQNINLSTNVAQTRVEHLRNQRNLRFQVYNSIAQEVEQARMSLEQQIPLFNILEKPNLPQTPATSSSRLVLVFSILIGLFTGISVVLFKNSSLFWEIKQKN